MNRSQFVHFEIGVNCLPVTLDSFAQQGAAVVAVSAVVAVAAVEEEEEDGKTRSLKLPVSKLESGKW